MQKLNLDTEDIKRDISKIFDVSSWTFFFNQSCGLEFYETDPNYSYIYCSNFADYDYDIKKIAKQLLNSNKNK